MADKTKADIQKELEDLKAKLAEVKKENESLSEAYKTQEALIGELEDSKERALEAQKNQLVAQYEHMFAKNTPSYAPSTPKKTYEHNGFIIKDY